MNIAKIVKLMVLLFLDSAAFFFALLLTYFTLVTFQGMSISLLMIRAYLSVMIFLWLIFMILLNLFGFYFDKAETVQPRKIVFVTVLYFIILLFLSYFYPNYQFSRFLIFINYSFTYMLLNIFRLVAKKILIRE